MKKSFSEVCIRSVSQETVALLGSPDVCYCAQKRQPVESAHSEMTRVQHMYVPSCLQSVPTGLTQLLVSHLFITNTVTCFGPTGRPSSSKIQFSGKSVNAEASSFYIILRLG
jgi:hypothetical protein